MIKLAKDLDLPVEAVTETFAILAMKGKGKTYTGTKLFEEMFAVGGQCVALDPVGNWRFLRSDAAGDGDGLAVPVIGGPHRDLPILTNHWRLDAVTDFDRLALATALRAVVTP